MEVAIPVNRRHKLTRLRYCWALSSRKKIEDDGESFEVLWPGASRGQLQRVRRYPEEHHRQGPVDGVSKRPKARDDRVLVDIKDPLYQDVGQCARDCCALCGCIRLASWAWQGHELQVLQAVVPNGQQL